jgi:hypothetical protein
MRVVADRLYLRWYLGYDLHEPLPDHSSLTRIREHFGLEIFRRFFEKIVEECFEAGLWCGAKSCSLMSPEGRGQRLAGLDEVTLAGGGPSGGAPARSVPRGHPLLPR